MHTYIRTYTSRNISRPWPVFFSFAFTNTHACIHTYVHTRAEIFQDLGQYFLILQHTRQPFSFSPGRTYILTFIRTCTHTPKYLMTLTNIFWFWCAAYKTIVSHFPPAGHTYIHTYAHTHHIFMILTSVLYFLQHTRQPFLIFSRQDIHTYFYTYMHAYAKIFHDLDKILSILMCSIQDNRFSFSAGAHRFVFCAGSEEERDQWVLVLRSNGENNRC